MKVKKIFAKEAKKAAFEDMKKEGLTLYSGLTAKKFQKFVGLIYSTDRYTTDDVYSSWW